MNPYIRDPKRIEFVVTMACTGRCRHCSEGDHDGYTGHIDPKAAVRSVQEICVRYDIQSLMTFGGEPLLFPETVYAIQRTAASLGIPRRQVITNGYFSRDCMRIRETVLDLKECGVNSLLLSVDAFHQETIPLAPVRYFAECLAEAGIHAELSPAWLVSQDDINPYNIRTREILREFADLDIPVGKGNVIFPAGNALKYLREYFGDCAEPSSPYDDDPYDVRVISFDPDGSVLGGNIHQKSILEIIDEYHP